MAHPDEQASAVVQSSNADTGKDAPSQYFFKTRSGSWRGPSLAQLKAFFPPRIASQPRAKGKQDDNWREWSSFRLYPGISQADSKSPVAVNQLDGTLTDLVITKTVSLPVVGNMTITLKAGQGTPVSTSGLTTDLAGLSSESATFGGQAVTSNANGNAFEIDAKTATLNNVNISAPYLIANSMTLPGLTLTVN